MKCCEINFIQGILVFLILAAIKTERQRQKKWLLRLIQWHGENTLYFSCSVEKERTQKTKSIRTEKIFF